MSNFIQFDGVWLRGWSAYTTPHGGGIGQINLLLESREFDFSRIEKVQNKLRVSTVTQWFD